MIDAVTALGWAHTLLQWGPEQTGRLFLTLSWGAYLALAGLHPLPPRHRRRPTPRAAPDPRSDP